MVPHGCQREVCFYGQSPDSRCWSLSVDGVDMFCHRGCACSQRKALDSPQLKVGSPCVANRLLVIYVALMQIQRKNSFAIMLFRTTCPRWRIYRSDALKRNTENDSFIMMHSQDPLLSMDKKCGEVCPIIRGTKRIAILEEHL